MLLIYWKKHALILRVKPESKWKIQTFLINLKKLKIFFSKISQRYFKKKKKISKEKLNSILVKFLICTKWLKNWQILTNWAIKNIFRIFANAKTCSNWELRLKKSEFMIKVESQEQFLLIKNKLSGCSKKIY